MPVLPTFQPEGTPGETGQAFISAENASQNWMDRAQHRELTAEQLDQARQQSALEAIQLPVKKAQAQAALVGLGAAVATHTRQAEARTQAAAASPQAQNDFLDAIQLADWDAQSSALSGIQAKYGWMSQFDEYKPFLKSVDEARANAVIRAKTDQTLEAEQLRSETMANARMDASGNTLQGRVYTADKAAESRQAVAETGAASRETVATTQAGAKTASTAASMDRTEVRGDLNAAIEADKEALKFAVAGNDDAAAQARQRAQQFRDSAKQKAHPATEAGAPFSVPNVTDGKKLYVPPTNPGEPISISPEVRKPEQIIEALQQAVDAGDMSEDEARSTLEKLGFKRKGE